MTSARAMVTLSDVRARLRASGERMTQPRRVVLAVLADHADHQSAEQVVTAVEKRDPSVHRSTVYRTLETLADVGMVQHVHLGHGPTLYHLSGVAGDHAHLQCVSCGSITDASIDVLTTAAEHLDRRHGFHLDLGHVALSGTCADCRVPDLRVSAVLRARSSVGASADEQEHQDAQDDDEAGDQEGVGPAVVLVP